jgi:5-methylcytosine-specific restriction endonuclease McrA
MGYCEKHYERWHAHGDPLISKCERNHPATCTIGGCERPWASKGFCRSHYTSDWARRNPQRHNEHKLKRKAQKRQNGYEPINPVEIFERDNWLCYICGFPVSTKDASLDHVIPLIDGGPHYKSNVKTTHRICNIRKRERRISQLPLTMFTDSTDAIVSA